MTKRSHCSITRCVPKKQNRPNITTYPVPSTLTRTHIRNIHDPTSKTTTWTVAATIKLHSQRGPIAGPRSDHEFYLYPEVILFVGIMFPMSCVILRAFFSFTFLWRCWYFFFVISRYCCRTRTALARAMHKNEETWWSRVAVWCAQPLHVDDTNIFGKSTLMKNVHCRLAQIFVLIKFDMFMDE